MTGTAQAQNKFAACKPTETAVFPERIHVRCDMPVDGRFWYFAVPTTDSRNANRMLSLMIGAQLGDKFLSVLFDPADLSGGSFGCNVNDCRNIRALLMTERVPGKCEINSTQRGCPGFCAAVGNNDPDCPGYCERQADPRCQNFCQKAPPHPDCVVELDRLDKKCRRHPDSPECKP